MKIFFMIIIILLILLVAICFKSGIDRINESIFCSTHQNFSNLSSSSNYWLEQRTDGNYCCGIVSTIYYLRDDGTLNRFLFGKTGKYENIECEKV